MSWYKCECGHVFEDGEFFVKSQYVCEFRGTPAYQDFRFCPSCGSDEWEEAGHCAKCRGIFLDDELTEGLCAECLNEITMDYKYNIAKCYELSQKSGDTYNVSIDWFLSCMFTPEQINEVLYRELVSASAIKPIDCTPFIETDRYWFNEHIVRWVKNNESSKN